VLVIHAPTSEPWLIPFLAFVILLLLVRYLSTSYTIDGQYLRAWRILGGQRAPLKNVRRIEYASLRDLSATGFWGAWGWRGRMWSPRIGRFDAIYTDTAGLLVTAGDVPMFISPVDLQGFAQELSRRVRSLGGRLMSDESEP
jgi:Bacterial PH domain